MSNRPTDIGSSNAWLVTVPMEHLSETAPPPSARPRQRSSSRKKRKISVWHRPLGPLMMEAAARLVAAVAHTSLVSRALGTIAKDRSLTVVGQPLPRRPAATLTLGHMVRSAARFIMPAQKTPAPVIRQAAARRAAPERPARPAPFVAAPASAAASPSPSPAKVPLTRPVNETIGAFNHHQQLYSDGAMTLSYDPSGMGMLWVEATGRHRHVAGPEAKWYFLAVLKRFEELGEAMTSFNPKYTAMTRSFAEALLEHAPSDPIWSQMVADDPRHVARCFAGLDKPQNVVIEVQASQLQRVATPSSTSVAA